MISSQSRSLTDVAETRKHRRSFYGWYVVLAAFVVTLIGFGSAYTFGAFVGSLEHDFRASRGSVSIVFSLAGFLYFALGAFSGPLADRWGARRLAVLGMLVTGAGLIAAGFASSLTGVYFSYGLGIGLGVGLSYVPVLGAVQRWFIRRRGLASGLAVSGIGIGTLVMPPLASFLVAATGWRHAYLVLGLLAASVGCGFALLIANDPYEKGQSPDGDAVMDSAKLPQAQGVSIKVAVTSRRFICLYAACLIGSFGLFIPFVHLVPYAQDHGITPANAVLLLGMIGIGSTAGRFVLGGLADRMERVIAVLAMFVGIALSMIIWFASTGFIMLAVFASVFGIFYGGFVALLPALVMDDFGGKNVGGLIGILYTSVAFGTLVGPSLAGFAFDMRHSYSLSIVASAMASLVAACILVCASRARVPVQNNDLA
ncbi:putative MFS family arabinose efflux permease [Paraburkholderia sp. BL6665CI2N2]|uniref:MFS transporter n=1 Tax=Paraburkholderia sp. BL6665CI2N2 TaxID=1938806 RepID=UPI00106650D0|nr:MFS transporter [Paraburkholderia sp. BL6665CI2N2]TDY22049.1 putative MFS family arabinose efflux permease [Paraburkholderia sp. BL6665CI2N2]